MPDFFGKKKAEPVISVDQIMAMKQQGYQNSQIIQALQGQGYSSSQIFDVMNQVDGSGSGGMGQAPQVPQQQFAPPQQGIDPNQGMPPQQQDQFGPEAPFDSGIDDKERIEEVAEAIIDEKWNDLLKDINKISESNNKMESRLSKLEDDIKNLKENFDSLHRGILGKISDYDRNLVNVGTEIKAMEKVFQKILPTFTDNVNKLSRITEIVPRRGMPGDKKR